MARRTETITIEDEGRDKGKTFIVTEMPAIAGERWAAQLLKLVIAAGATLPDGAEQAGMEGLAAITNMGLPLLTAMLDPALDVWWSFVAYQHAPNLPVQPINQGDTCQIEEMATVTRLRVEFLKLHTGFFSPEKASTTGSPSRAIPTGSSPTRMSRPRSAQ